MLCVPSGRVLNLNLNASSTFRESIISSTLIANRVTINVSITYLLVVLFTVKGEQSLSKGGTF